MKNRFFLLMLLSVMAMNAQAQFISDLIDPTFLNPDFRKSKSLDKVEGTPYLNEDWKRGKIILLSGQSFDNISMKYDIYGDQVVVKGPDDNEAEFNKNRIQSFIIYGQRDAILYNFVKLENGDFYNLVFDGKNKIYQKFKKRIHVSEVNSGGFGSPESKSTFLNDDKVYIKLASGEMKEFDKEKRLYELFPDKSESIKLFIKTNKLKFKSLDDLVKVIQYMENM
jgi:hypothetical protein